MKKGLDFKSKMVVDSYDDVNLWSAPFALLMLEHIPIKQSGTIVDLGFGTGFPLIELCQRFGSEVKWVGVDVWKEAEN